MSTTPPTPGDALPPDDSARGQGGNVEPKKPKPKKRRLALKICLGVVLVIAVLVALAPTIVSMGWVRLMVLDRVNADYINGHVEIADWSFGWFTSPRIEGIKVSDDRDSELLEVHSITGSRSLLEMLGMNFGDITADGINPNARIYKDGTLNLAGILKPSNKPPSTTPSKLPNIRVKLNASGAGGTFTNDRVGLTSIVDSFTLQVVVTSVNDPIAVTLDARTRAQGKSLGEEQIDGTVTIAKDYSLLVNRAGVVFPVAEVKTQYKDVDTAVIADLMQLASLPYKVQFSGLVNGEITASVKSEDDLSVLADLAWDKPTVTLKGDVVADARINATIDASLLNGQLKVKSKVDGVPLDGSKNDELTATVDASEDSLQHMATVLTAVAYRLTGQKLPADFKVETPGGAPSGTIIVTGDIGIAPLVSQLKHTISLMPGATITDGRSYWTLSHDLATGLYTLATGYTGVAGTSNGKQVALKDLDLKASLATTLDASSPLKEIQLALTGGFINITGGGPTLSNLDFESTVSLEDLQQQAGQLFDLSGFGLKGKLFSSLKTTGDLSKPSGVVNVDFVVKADPENGVEFRNPSGLGFDEKQLNIHASGEIHRDAEEIFSAIKNMQFSIQTPSTNLALDADLRNDGNNKFTVTRGDINGTIDGAGLQQEAGSMLAWLVAREPASTFPKIIGMIGDKSMTIRAAPITISGELECDTSHVGWIKPLTLMVGAQRVEIADELAGVKTYDFPAAGLVIAGSGSSNNQDVVDIKGLSATLTIGTPDAPVIPPLVVTADATVELNPTGGTGADGAAEATVKDFSIQQATLQCAGANLAKLQDVYAPVLPYCVRTPTDGSAPTVVQSIMLGALKVTTGTLSMSAKGSYGNNKIDITQPLTVDIDSLTLLGPDGNPVIDHEPVHAVCGGSFAYDGKHYHLNSTDLNVKLGNDLEINLVRGPLTGSYDSDTGQGMVTGDIQLTRADLPRLARLAGLFNHNLAVALADLKSGTATSDIALTSAPDGGLGMSTDLNVNGFTFGKAFNNENIVIHLGGSLSRDHQSISDFALTIPKTSLADGVEISHGQLTFGDLPTMIKSLAGTVTIDRFDAAKGLAIVKAVNPSAAAQMDGQGGVTVILADVASPAEPAAHPAPTLQSGLVSFNGTFAGGNLNGTYLLHGVVLQHPDDKKIYMWPGDISGQAGADVVIGDKAQVESVTISQLSGDAGIFKFGLAKQSPILASHFSGDVKTCQISGAISIDGQIGPICQAVEFLGYQPANALPYGGTCHLQEAIQKNADSPRIDVTGGGSVEHFAAYGPPPPRTTLPKLLFTQDQFTLASNCDYDLDNDTLIIDPASPLSVDLPDVLTVNVTGSLAQLKTQRNFDGFSVESKYNLAKLWPIAKPLLSADTQSELADLVISGNYDRIFHLSGSYPADQTFAQNILLIGADGRITVEKLATHGATIEDFDLPVLLHGGVVRTVYVDKPEGQNAPIPGKFNGGILDPGVLSADFRGPSPLVTMEHTDPEHPHMVVKGASINSTFANSFFGKFLNNPAFAGASKADGSLDMTVLDLRTTPLDGTYANQNPQNPEHVHLVWSLHGLHLGAPLISQIPGCNIPMDINDADVTIEQGVLHEDTTLMVGQSPMRIWGGVGLQTNKFIGMQIQIPLPLLSALVPNQGLMAFMPKSITIPVEGTPDHPIIRIDKAIGKLIKDAVLKAGLQNIIPGNNGGGGNNPLGGLLNGLTGHH